MKKRIIVIGGGPAGMMAAGFAAGQGAQVTLLERNPRMGRKLMITGKGRCNLTNSCDTDTFLQNVATNSRFLYSAVSGFSPAMAMAFFEAQGLRLKTERGNRVFPASDKAVDVVDTLVRFVRQSGVQVVQERAAELEIAGGRVCAVIGEKNRYACDAVILCTGGKSYPLTGSTGDGYRIARQAGHTVIEPRPSLVPLLIAEPDCAQMQGLSLRNVAVSVYAPGTAKSVYEDFGELLFTHFGVSGPVILSASAHLRDVQKTKYRLVIDCKPALSAAQLDARIVRDFQSFSNRDFSNALHQLLPAKMIPVAISRSGIEPERKVNQITKSQRKALIEVIKAFAFTITGARPIEEAIITAGGVCVKEVSPKTMMSKLVKGFYFAGEVLDVDAYTGGFNLQIAYSTAAAAANAAVQEEGND